MSQYSLAGVVLRVDAVVLDTPQDRSRFFGNEESHYEPMEPTTRKRLGAFFEPHNRRLYDHLGRNLGW
jgi:hypothetical protein